MESGEHASHVWVDNMTRAHKLACMHTMLLHAWTDILAKLGQITGIKVSIESEEHAGHVWEHKLAQAHKLVCMYALFLCAEAHKSAKLHYILEIRVSRSCEGARGPQNRPKAPKQPSAGARKRGTWAHQFTSKYICQFVYVLLKRCKEGLFIKSEYWMKWECYYASWSVCLLTDLLSHCNFSLKTWISQVPEGGSFLNLLSTLSL